jgi:cell division inhibitor SepF
MGLKHKFKNFFVLDDEQEYEEQEMPAVEEEDEMSKQLKAPKGQQNVISLQSVQKSTKMVLCEPRIYAEAQEITDHLKAKKAVVVNLHRVSRDQAVRIVDFLTGTVYALGGDAQKIGPDIFLCTPDTVEVSGNISEILTEAEQTIKRW